LRIYGLRVARHWQVQPIGGQPVAPSHWSFARVSPSSQTAGVPKFEPLDTQPQQLPLFFVPRCRAARHHHLSSIAEVIAARLFEPALDSNTIRFFASAVAAIELQCAGTNRIGAKAGPPGRHRDVFRS